MLLVRQLYLFDGTASKKVEDQLETNVLQAPPEPALTCVQCGSEYKESLNSGMTLLFLPGPQSIVMIVTNWLRSTVTSLYITTVSFRTHL